MTYREICERLRGAGIESAEWDAELLLEHFCGVTRAAILADAMREYPSKELADAVERRASRYPLQYLLGEWQFYRQSYEVTPDCLIPRADTEILVEEAIHRLPRGAYFADLCTGSGCIAISILAERSDTRGVAVEKFPRTLSLAKRNAVRNGVAERFCAMEGDVLGASYLPEDACFDAILSNPPYIRPDVLGTLAPELSAEPLAALDGGADGLVFYRAILQNAKKYLKPNGFFLFEIGYDQAEELRLLGEENGLFSFEVLRDYGGQDRVAILSR